MPAFLAPLAIAGISALSGWLNNRKQKQQQEQKQEFSNTSSQSGQFNNSSSTTPVLTGEQSALQSQLINNFMSRGFDFNKEADSVVSGNINDINRGADTTRRAIINQLAQRGLSGSPAQAAALAQFEGERVGNVNREFGQRQLLADELRNKYLAQGTSLFSALPKGSYSYNEGSTSQQGTNSGTSSGTGTITQPGNQLGGIFGDLAGTLAFLYGNGAFGGKSAFAGYPDSMATRG